MWPLLGRRHIEPELMDEADPRDARQCLRDLVRINDAFGGHSTTRRLLARAGCEAGDSFSLLDVGAGSGDSARLIQQLYPQAKVVSLDRNEVNLGAASAPKVLGDAFRLPFPPKSFDFVFTSLFLHHFKDEQVVALLGGFRAVARNAVLISDLERHVLPYWFLPASRKMFDWHWMTVHDGRISVRAAFRARELQELARRAGLANVLVRRHRPAFRLSLVGRAPAS